MATRVEDSVLVVLTTLPSEPVARELVNRLVEDRVIACGTVLGGARSIYRWEGRVEQADEAQVILKTRRGRWDDLVAAIRRHHPYDVPELLALPVELGLPTYLAWVHDETCPEGEGKEA